MPLADALPVEVYFDQPELGVYYSPARTKAAAGSPLGMIVVMGLQGKAERGTEESVSPVRDRLLDYSFKDGIAPLLRDRINAPGLSPAPQLTWARSAGVSFADAARMPAQALVLMPYYAVDQDYRRLFVRLDARYVERTQKSSGALKVKDLVFHRYEFSYLLTDAQEAEARTWSDFGSAALQAMLERATAQVVDMLLHDFSAEGRAQWQADTRRQSVVLDGHELEGKEERRGERWLWVRGKTDDVHALQGYQVLTPAVLADLAAPSGLNATGGAR
jgi:hypothetical protein